MPPARRITRTLGYAAITLALLTAAAWIASGWYGVAYAWRGTRSVSLGAGWIEYINITPFPAPTGLDLRSVLRQDGWFLWSRKLDPSWRFDYLNVNVPGQTTLGIPFWPLPPLLAALGITVLYRTRTRPPHHCTKCKYDLTGLRETSPCPECGTPRTPPRPG